MRWLLPRYASDGGGCCGRMKWMAVDLWWTVATVISSESSICIRIEQKAVLINSLPLYGESYIYNAIIVSRSSIYRRKMTDTEENPQYFVKKG
jgi:hypothetical protein